MTKFFYRTNHLCFQIVLVSDAENEKNIVLGEFTNYAEYRKDFSNFQQQLEQNLPIVPATKVLESQKFVTSLVA